MARSRAPSTAGWTGLEDRAQVALLERLRRRLESDYPGGVASRVDARRRVGSVELAGTGKRRLPGMRRDLRRHALRAATDGRFLALSYERDGELLDTATIAAPSAADVEAVAAFFARHAPRIWWKGPAPLPPEERPAPRARPTTARAVRATTPRPVRDTPSGERTTAPRAVKERGGGRNPADGRPGDARKPGKTRKPGPGRGRRPSR